jgi:hypothetical protein
MTSTRSGRMALIEACRRALPESFSLSDRTAIEQYLLDLASGGVSAPKRGRGFDWGRVARDSAVCLELVDQIRDQLRPVLQAYAAPALAIRSTVALVPPSVVARRRPGTTVMPVVEYPPADPAPWKDTDSLRGALTLHMRRHGDTAYSLHRALAAKGAKLALSTLAIWRRGGKAPQSVESLKVFGLIEDRYRLPEGYFALKRQRAPRAVRRRPIPGVAPSEMRRLAWHLPDDFEDRSPSAQLEILAWVREVVIAGTTDYRKFQAAALKHRYGFQFAFAATALRDRHNDAGHGGPRRSRGAKRLMAPPELDREMASLVAFKTGTLTAPGFRRSGVWGTATAGQRTEHFGLLFGAMAAPPEGPVAGLGVPRDDLSFALLVLPAVWDWYVQWRERRRGFFTRWEVDLLSNGVAMVREGTGWLRQNPGLADRLRPIEGLVSQEDVARCRADWKGVCDAAHTHGLARAKEIDRVARVHRDPFEPILPILEAENPLAEYRKITDEIARRMPNPRKYPKAAAEAVRAFLMLRIGLHTGLRQRNLRELMLCPRGAPARSERWLMDNRRGELRWIDRDKAWEVYIPAVAFKNAASSFFGSRPFRLQLPDLSDLNENIDAYVDRHRQTLLGASHDPGTFFIKSAKVTSRTAAYDQTTFYETWRLAIQRYGIFNPYTGQGAIRACCLTARTMSGMYWRPIFSNRPAPTNKRATRYRTRRRWWPSTTDASYPRTRPRLLRRY